MLSPHEISTLLLIQRAPHQVEWSGQYAARLRQEALVEIGSLPGGDPLPLLTPKGQDLLRRLDALSRRQPADIDESE